METEDRPRRSVLDWALEIVSLTTLLAAWAVLAAHWTDLPSQVPQHFDSSGNPDGWGNKNGLLLLPLTATGVYALLTAASRYQKLMSIPIRVNRDAREVKSLLLNMAITFKAIVLLILLYLTWGSVNIAIGSSTSLAKGFLPFSLAAVFLVLGVYLVKLWRYRT